MSLLKIWNVFIIVVFNDKQTTWKMKENFDVSSNGPYLEVS